MNEQVIIVGAGVAGLSLAIMLKTKNIDCQVLEARQSFDGATSGVRVSAGGVKILEQMNIESVGGLTEKVLMRLGSISVDFNCTVSPLGTSAIIVTRLALFEQLMTRVKALGVQVTTGFAVATISQLTNGGVEVTSTTGQKVVGKILVGADGVGSIVRQLLNPGAGSSKAYAGYLGIGFITQCDEKVEMTLHGHPGHQVGVASCGKVCSDSQHKSVFMWTHMHIPESDAKTATKQTVDAELERRSAVWNPELQRLHNMYKADPESILAFGPVYNGRPPATWFDKNMILIGDAAHPYGPGGQGISMALKDAKALCDVISEGFTEEGETMGMF
jgi:2-polyprenyl-6-methoxyphenol hydroxylase-like FAD-dependent oxidoreductase